MGKLSEHISDKSVMLFWGPPKVGKTVLASQFPQPFFVDLDDGISSVKAMRAALGLTFDFDVVSIDSNPTEDEDYIKLCGKAFASQSAWTKTKKLINVLSRKLPPSATLVIDNLSRINEYIIGEIQDRANRRQLQIQDWGVFVDEVGLMLTDIKKCKCNVIIIAHEEYQKDALTEELHKYILISTRARYRIPSAVTDYLYMKNDISGPNTKRVINRVLQSMPDPVTNTGSRALIPNIVNPTYKKLRPFLKSALNRDPGEPTWTPPDPEPQDVRNKSS